MEEAVEVTVQKWGNSLAVRIPKPVAHDANLAEGSVVDVRVVEGKLVAEPVAPRYRLADLLRQVKRSNLHHEVQTGPAMGGEVW